MKSREQAPIAVTSIGIDEERSKDVKSHIS